MIQAGIVGATGYTGVELLRLLSGHPEVEVVAVSSDSEAGQPVADVHPHLRAGVDLAYIPHQQLYETECDGGVLRGAEWYRDAAGSGTPGARSAGG